MNKTSVADPPYGETVTEETIDVSLENALTYPEASVAVEIEFHGGCAGYSSNWRWNQMSLGLRDFRIVVTG